MDVPGTTTIIELPEAMRPQLEAKLVEYKMRLDRDFWKNGGYTPPECFAAWYAQRILGTLLRDGRVDTWALCREMFAEMGDVFNLDYFENYCGAMHRYVTGAIPLVIRQ